jgi:cytochrome o ubiquinol oxidase subunit 1
VVNLCGILCTIIQLVVSIRDRAAHRDRTGDPWNGRTLEWSTASPPPSWNFALMPLVASEDAYWYMKRDARENRGEPAPEYEAIEMPVNSATGFITAFFAVITGFALIWHIWWMVGLGLFGAFATMLVLAWRDHDEMEIPVEEVARMDQAHRTEIAR